MELVKPEEFVLVAGDQIVTDSLKVARHFNKQHKDVLRTIRGLLRKLPESAKRNFSLCFEVSELQNKKPNPFYRMTRNGFVLVAMRYTTDKALAVQLAFLDAFDRMAEFIQQQASSAWEAFNTAYQRHLSDKQHVSRCAGDMRRWQCVKPQQLEYLERLHPQMPLFPALQ